MDTALIVITLGSLVAAFVNAAFATGGVYVTLISSLAVLPVSAAVPLQSAFAVGSLLARIGLFWKDIQWRIVGTFVFGCLFGVYFGARAFVALSDALLHAAGPHPAGADLAAEERKRHEAEAPFCLCRRGASFVGTMFGVGGILQPFILRTNLRKMQITGTLAACMISLDAMKMTSYVLVGFRYQDYVPHIVLATLAGFAGAWLGKRATVHVSERAFRIVFRWLITLAALRLVWGGWSALAA
jgi:uncharacterized membrane protein YfcA